MIFINEVTFNLNLSFQLLVLAAIVAISVAAPQNVGNAREATIIEQTNDNIGIGPWSWR